MTDISKNGVRLHKSNFCAIGQQLLPLLESGESYRLTALPSVRSHLTITSVQVLAKCQEEAGRASENHHLQPAAMRLMRF